MDDTVVIRTIINDGNVRTEFTLVTASGNTVALNSLGAQSLLKLVNVKVQMVTNTRSMNGQGRYTFTSEVLEQRD